MDDTADTTKNATDAAVVATGGATKDATNSTVVDDDAELGPKIAPIVVLEDPAAAVAVASEASSGDVA